LRPLETRTRIATDTRGITANEFLAWSVGISWSTRLAGKKNDIFLDDGFRGFTLRGKSSVGFGFDVRDEFFRTLAGMAFGLILGFAIRFVPGFLFGIVFAVKSGFGSFDGFLMFAVGFVLGIFVSVFGFIVFGIFTIFFVVEVIFGLVSFFIVFVEGGATKQSVGLGASLRFLVLGFDDVGGKSGELLFVEGGRAVMSRMRGCQLFMMFLSRRGLGGLGRSCSSKFLRRSGLRRFGFGIGKHPMRQAA